MTRKCMPNASSCKWVGKCETVSSFCQRYNCMIFRNWFDHGLVDDLLTLRGEWRWGCKRHNKREYTHTWNICAIVLHLDDGIGVCVCIVCDTIRFRCCWINLNGNAAIKHRLIVSIDMYGCIWYFGYTKYSALIDLCTHTLLKSPYLRFCPLMISTESLLGFSGPKQTFFNNGIFLYRFLSRNWQRKSCEISNKLSLCL